jgi:hypothetical protein
MRRVTFGVILLALLAAPAFAEDKNAVTAEEILKKKDSESVDKQYDSTMKRLKQDGTPIVRSDPWANMRAPATNDNKR